MEAWRLSERLGAGYIPPNSSARLVLSLTMTEKSPGMMLSNAS
jgi:hypothetical protein